MKAGQKALWKKAVLIAILVLPVSFYLISIVISGELGFHSLEIIGPREAFVNEDGEPDTAYYRVPEFSFTDQYGREVNNETMKGKIYVASFFFTTCPTICPAMNFHLREVHNRLLAYKDIYYLSHTVDPDHDSVEVLNEYAKELMLPTGDKWLFVTGDKEKIYSMAGAYFLAASADSSDHGAYTHSQQVVLVDWEGRLRSRKDDNGNVIGAYDLGVAADVKDIVDDLRVLAKEYRTIKTGS